MPKFEKKPKRPTVEAIQINWRYTANAAGLVNGAWVILNPDGTTTWTSDPDFRELYQRVGD